MQCRRESEKPRLRRRTPNVSIALATTQVLSVRISSRYGGVSGSAVMSTPRGACPWTNRKRAGAQKNNWRFQFFRSVRADYERESGGERCRRETVTPMDG